MTVLVKSAKGGNRMLYEYQVKSIEYLTANRMSRPVLAPGFPYISFNAVETLHLMQAMKVLHRDSVMEAIFDNKKRERTTKITAANKVLNLLVNKGYAKVAAADHALGYFYTLDRRGIAYLRMDPNEMIESVETKELAMYYVLNRVFISLVKKYRDEYNMYWGVEIGRKPADGYCRLKKDKEEKIIMVKLLKPVNVDNQVKEIEKLVEEMPNSSLWLEANDVLVASPFKVDSYLEIMKDKEICVDEDKIKAWVRSS